MSSIKRIFANFSLLAAGRVGTTLLNLGAIVVMARALDLNDFGTVVLVHVYLLTIRGLANLKPFLAMVQWGVPALDSDDRGTLTQLLILTRRIDWCAALMAALLGIGLAPVAGAFLGWEDRIVQYSMALSIVLVTSGTGTAVGFLRLMDRFDVLSLQLVIGPAMRCLGALVAWFQEAPIDAFVIIWGLSLGVESLYLSWRGYRECRNQGYIFSIFEKISLTPFQGLPRFLGIAYVQNILDMVPQRFATMMVGAVLGAGSAGLFRAARECSTVITRPGILLRQVTFPDLTRLWATDRSMFGKVIFKVCAAAGAIGLTLVILAMFFGGWVMGSLFGADFRVAGNVLIWLLLAGTFELSGSLLRPAGYAMNRSGSILVSHAVGTVLFLVAFYPFQSMLGLTGAGVALSLSTLTAWLGMLYVVMRRMKDS